MKIETKTDSNSFMFVRVLGGGGEGMNNEIKQQLDEKAQKELNDSEQKVWNLCNLYIEREFKNLGDNLKEIGEKLITIEKRLENMQEDTEKLKMQREKKTFYNMVHSLRQTLYTHSQRDWQRMTSEVKKDIIKDYNFYIKKVTSIFDNSLFEKFEEIKNDIKNDILYSQVSQFESLLDTDIRETLFLTEKIKDDINTIYSTIDKIGQEVFKDRWVSPKPDYMANVR